MVGMGVIATVLPWASNMVDKKMDTKSLDEVNGFFKTLDTSIRDIANNGGEESLTLEVPGILTIYPSTVTEPNNSIVFNFRGKVSNVAACGLPNINDCWIPLNTPNTNETGTLGIDSPSVIFGVAEKKGNFMNVSYKLWYRELYDSSSLKGFRINITTLDGNTKSTTNGFLRIQRTGSTPRTVGYKTITTTEINIIV